MYPVKAAWRYAKLERLFGVAVLQIVYRDMLK